MFVMQSSVHNSNVERSFPDVWVLGVTVFFFFFQKEYTLDIKKKSLPIPVKIAGFMMLKK